jgi:hypothetical protein
MAVLTDLKKLLQTAFPGATVAITRFSPGGRVGGSLIWDGFDGKLQIDRQTHLRQVVDKLPKKEHSKVSFILTLTKDEYASITAK